MRYVVACGYYPDDTNELTVEFDHFSAASDRAAKTRAEAIVEEIKKDLIDPNPTPLCRDLIHGCFVAALYKDKPAPKNRR